MTVENLLSLLAPHPSMGHKMPLDQTLSGFPSTNRLPPTNHLNTPAGTIAIPTRTRHPSWGSTGSSMGSGKSSPLSGSPLQEFIGLPGIHFPGLVSGSTKTHRGSSVVPPDVATTNHKNVNPTRYKTEMCRPFEESGHCKYGDKCQFAHGRHELRNLSRHPKYKTELCRTYHTVGFCPYGPRCHFIHNEDELKLGEITQMKHQQIMQQVAQQVAQHQVLSRIALTHHVAAPLPEVSFMVPVAKPRVRTTLDLSGLSLGSETTTSSLADSPPMTPTSMLTDEVFSRVATPPPGFTALPPTHFGGASFGVAKTSSAARCSTPIDVEPPQLHRADPLPSSSPLRLPIFSSLSLDS